MMSRSFDEKESRKNSRITLPLSSSPTETASVEDASITSSLASNFDSEPNWPPGWRPYVCLLACFFQMFNSWGLVNAYGTFSSFYVGNTLRNNDQLQLNLIGSTQSFLVLLFSAPVGRLLDAGNFRYVVSTGAFLVPFGMFMLSVAHPNDDNGLAKYINIWITQGLVVGLGMACFFVSSSQIAATWFPNRKGLAVGFVACGASIAGVVYPTMLRYLIDALGFNTAVRLVATLVAVTAIFSAIFATPNPAHVHSHPQSYRQLKTWIDTDAFRNKAFCWFSAAVAFLFFGFYPVFFNLEEWAAVNGYGTRNGSRVPVVIHASTPQPLQTFWLLTIMNGASTFGRLTMATFADRTGALNMHIVAQVVSSLLVMILWALAGSTTAAIAFCVFFGMFSGAVIGLPPASMANILRCTYNTPSNNALAHGKLGHWVGMMYSFAAIPALTGPVIAGHLVTQYSTYITVHMWAGANLMLSALCMLMARWHLPCADGEHVSVKLAHLMGRRPSSSFDDKGKESETDYDNAMAAISQATTRIPSEFPSRDASGSKLNTLAVPEAVLGSDRRV